MDIILILIFLTAYAAIIFEHPLKIDKAATALCAGVICWTLCVVTSDSELLHLGEHLGETAGILFFLLGAMIIVEVIDMHNGFRFITDKIKTRDKRKLLWIIGLITFFLSAALDNMTTAIVMVSLLPKLMSSYKDRLYFASLIIVAANAGGAWSPIGDVTTTMLWIGKQVSADVVMKNLFIPSLIAFLVPLLGFTFILKGNIETPPDHENRRYNKLPERLRKNVLFLGVALLLAVPVFKTYTGMPPYMGMLLSLSVFWIYNEIIYRKRGGLFKKSFSLNRAISQVNMSTIFFFLGILLCVSALHAYGVLTNLAETLNQHVGDKNVLTMLIGMVSAIIDNVPLVAIAQVVYTYPMNDFFWILLCFAVGTGGSLLIIGSAAGVAAMGLEKIDFLWYVKKISPLVLLGYIAGGLVLIFQYNLFFK